MNLTLDKSTLSVMFENPAFYKDSQDYLCRGGKIRCITEITPENTQKCKELLNLNYELRHLDELKCVMVVNDSEYMAATVLGKGQPMTQIIYSNSDDVVVQGQYLFETLWSNSISALKRIKEIELEIEPIKTQVLENAQEAASNIYKVIMESKYLSVCCTADYMQLISKYYLDINKKMLEKHHEGKSKAIRWITSINDNKDIDVVNAFTRDPLKIRHTSERLPINFVVSDKYIASTTENMIGGNNFFSHLLLSNDPLYVEHFYHIFNKIWKQSVVAEDRIKELTDSEFFKARIISNPQKSLRLIKKYYSLAQKDILIILPSFNGLIRMERSKNLEKLNELASDGILVKILIIQSQGMDYLREIKKNYSHIKFRTTQINFPIYHRITIIDKTTTIILKIKDDTITNTPIASGITTFIDGQTTALSYTGIFETIWNQAEMFESLKKINEKLHSHKRMQQEFLGMIAHELRNPIQPIIGLTEYVKDKIKDKRQIELLDSVINCGQKLNALTENLLDVSHIEDNIFSIDKKKFDLSKSISNIIKIFDNLLRKTGKKIEFRFNYSEKEYFIVADRNRIEQALSNLIHNSIKSISRKPNVEKQGIISIRIKELTTTMTTFTNSSRYGKKKGQIIEISIEDNGQGIDSKIMKDLFKKFKSTDGYGLGLYISRKIIEAHGGNIFADKKKKDGAKFIISLPMLTKELK